MCGYFDFLFRQIYFRPPYLATRFPNAIESSVLSLRSDLLKQRSAFSLPPTVCLFSNLVLENTTIHSKHNGGPTL